MTSSSGPELNQDVLLQLYKIAIDEYRFNVQMGWNRQQYYLVFNGALTGLAATLLGQGGTAKQLFSIMVFLLGIGASLLGRAAISKSHEYYRRAAYKKTLIEHRLGLLENLLGYSYSGANLAIATTAGMHSVTQILNETEDWIKRPERRGNIVWYLRAYLAVIIAVNALGIVFAAYALFFTPAIPLYV